MMWNESDHKRREHDQFTDELQQVLHNSLQEFEGLNLGLVGRLNHLAIDVLGLDGLVVDAAKTKALYRLAHGRRVTEILMDSLGWNIYADRALVNWPALTLPVAIMQVDPDPKAQEYLWRVSHQMDGGGEVQYARALDEVWRRTGETLSAVGITSGAGRYQQDEDEYRRVVEVMETRPYLWPLVGRARKSYYEIV